MRSEHVTQSNGGVVRKSSIRKLPIGWCLTCWANTTLLVSEYFSFSGGGMSGYMCLYVPTCLDMRQASQAAQREKHPMPTIEETARNAKDIHQSKSAWVFPFYKILQEFELQVRGSYSYVSEPELDIIILDIPHNFQTVAANWCGAIFCVGVIKNKNVRGKSIL